MTNHSSEAPSHGQWIRIDSDLELEVPDNPIIGFIEGDGVGPDIWAAARPVFDSAVKTVSRGAREIDWWEIPAGEKSFRDTEEYLPASSLQAINKALVVIKGPLTTPVGGGFRSLNVILRKELDLYACIRPVRHVPGTPSGKVLKA